MESYFLLSEIAASTLNHTPRRCRENRTASRTYFGGDRIRYSRRERRHIFRWVRDLATELSARVGKPKITKVEWRIAANLWLLKNDLTKIVRWEKCHPI